MGEIVWTSEFRLDTPIFGHGDQVLCQGCCCSEVVPVFTYWCDGAPVQLFTCPHIDIWIRPTGLLQATTKGVRH